MVRKNRIIILLLLLSSLGANAQTILSGVISGGYVDTVESPTATSLVKFNFAPAGTLDIPGYTSVYGDPRASVLTATGNGISISTIQNYPLWSAGTFTFSSGNTGKGTGSNSGIRPDSVIISEFFRYNDTFSDTATSKCFQIWGLTPGATYVVKMGGSRDINGVTDPHQLGDVEYRVMGVPQTLNTDDNTTSELTFTNVVADVNGCVSVFVGQVSGDLNFGFIGWLEILQ